MPQQGKKECLETSFLHAGLVEKKTKPAPKIIIETMLAAGMTQTEAAEHFNVSTRWIRTLHKRYKEGGIKALEPRSKRPHTNPRALNNNLVDRILQLRQELINRGTDAGAHTIGWHLEREGINPPCQHHQQFIEYSQTTTRSHHNPRSVLAAHGYVFNPTNPMKPGKWITVIGQ